MSEKNILVLCMSTLPFEKKVSHYFFNVEGRGHYRFNGISQLEAGTKTILNTMAEKDETIHKIIVLNTDKTKEDLDDQTTASAYSFYKNRINDYINGVEKYDFSNEISEKHIELKEKIEMEIQDSFTEGKYDYEEINKKQREVANKVIADYKKEFDIDGIMSFDEEFKMKFIMLEDACVKQLFDRAIKDENELDNSDELINQYKDKIGDLLREALVDDKKVVDALILWEKYIYENLRNVLLNCRKNSSELISLLSYQNYVEQIHDNTAKFEKIVGKLKIKIDYLENKLERRIREYTKEYAYYYCDTNNIFLEEEVPEQIYKLSKLYSDKLVDLYESIVLKDNNADTLIDIVKCITELQEKNEENEENKEINVYMDMQGGDRTAAYVVSVAMELLKGRNIKIIERVATDFEPSNLSNEIKEVTDEYKVSDVISGLNAFSNYGRGTDLSNYISNKGYQKESKESKLTSIIQKISDAIEISDPNSFESALAELKDENQKLLDQSEYTNPYIKLILNDIKSEYGSLLDQNSSTLDYIKWFVEKGFTSQALTFVEDKVPAYLINENLNESTNKIFGVSYEAVGYSETEIREMILRKGNAWEKRISNTILNKVGPDAYNASKNRCVLEIVALLADGLSEKYIKENKDELIEKLKKNADYSNVPGDKGIYINRNMNNFNTAVGTDLLGHRFCKYIYTYSGNNNDEVRIKANAEQDRRIKTNIKNLKDPETNNNIRIYENLKTQNLISVTSSDNSLKTMLTAMIIKAFSLFLYEKRDRRKILGICFDDNGIEQYFINYNENQFFINPENEDEEEIVGNIFGLWKQLVKQYIKNNEAKVKISIEEIDEITDSLDKDQWLYNMELYNRLGNKIREILKNTSFIELNESDDIPELYEYKTFVNEVTLIENTNNGDVKINLDLNDSFKDSDIRRRIDSIICKYRELKNERNLINHAVQNEERKDLETLKKEVLKFVEEIRECERIAQEQ